MTGSPIERRRFLQAAAISGGAAVALPSIFADAVGAAAAADTIVVTVTLAGGNDGLNTIGPFTDGKYRDARGELAIPVGPAHLAGDGQYFHPKLRRLATRFRRGDVAVVQGVGDNRLDHSHFSNLARWQSGTSTGGISRTGWIGRWLDQSNGGPFAGVAIGGQGIPLHFRSASSSVTDLPHEGGALYGSDRSERRDRIMYNTIERMARTTRQWPWVDAVAGVNALSIDTAVNVSPAYNGQLPEDRVRSDLVLSARLINLGLGVRALNIWHGGFDTHDNQIGTSSSDGEHAELLDSLDVGLDAFFTELNPAFASKVVVMLYSEFGRRVEANGSRGTDHGTASNVVVIGRGVRGGLYGDPPDLRRLDDRGDLRFGLDFRRVYATLIDDWLGGSSASVLGANYQSLGLFAPTRVSSDLGVRADQIRSRRSQTRRDYLEYHTPRF